MRIRCFRISTPAAPTRPEPKSSRLLGSGKTAAGAASKAKVVLPFVFVDRTKLAAVGA